MNFGHMILRQTSGLRSPLLEHQDSMKSDFPLAAKGILVPATMALLLIQRISGNMILTPIPGRRKLISGEQEELLQWDFLLAARDISVPETIPASLQRIFGNMILPQIPGLRKPTSGEQRETGLSDFP